MPTERDSNMKKFFKEFKEFALTGSIMDMAVGVILGGAVSKMVSALVNNIFMPLIGIFLGGVDFSSLAFTIGDASIAYGLFIQSVVEFFIIAVCIFAMIKGLAALDKTRKELIHEEEKKKKEEKPEEKKESTEDILVDIRNLLQQEQKSQS